MHRTIVLSLLLSLATTGLAACGQGDEPRFRPADQSARSADDGEHGGRIESPHARSPHAAADPHGAVDPHGDHDTPPPPPTPTPTEPPPPAAEVDPRLMRPGSLTERAPDTFAVELDTTEGTITLDVHRAWSPNGADRFYNLVRAGYYTDIAFFRVIDGFMAQCGIHGSPAVNTVWHEAGIPDDPAAGQHNTRGMVSFATAGPDTRTTQFFINFADNSRLDGMGFTPFAQVRDMSVVDRLYSRYGEGQPGGMGPSQARMNREGNAYLRAEYPELDYIRSARIVGAP